jgi:hypothetical protein
MNLKDNKSCLFPARNGIAAWVGYMKMDFLTHEKIGWGLLNFININCSPDHYYGTCFRFGRKKSVIIAMILAFIASAISVAIPNNDSSGE